MITLVLEALFALVFVRALLTYARGRDPLQRDVALVFSALAVLLVLEIARRWGFVLPVLVGALAAVLLLAQPYLTLRLVGQLRAVPAWLRRAAFAGFVLTALPLSVAPRRLPPWSVLVIVVVYFGTELLAGTLFGIEARRRSGSPRARLWFAAGGTAAMAAALLVAGAGGLAPGERWIGLVAQMFALAAAVAYLVAFLPPRWLRNVWSAGAIHEVSQQLMQAPANEPPLRTWARYAETVRKVAGCDAAIVLLEGPDGGVVEIASTDTAPAAERVTSSAELERVLAAPQPIRLMGRHHRPVPALAEEYALRVGARVVNAVPLRIPPHTRGALILVNRFRRLFSADDVELLGALGTAAGVLAERGTVLAEQERLTAELAESIEALQRVSQAKSDFLASMSHELRTPLNSIIGFSELMHGEKMSGDLRMVPDEWIEHIHSSGRRLLALINDILDLTKVEAGRMELRLEPLELGGAVTEVLAGQRPFAEKKHLRVCADVPAIEVLADRIRLRQILDNLLSNAVKFTPDGGTVSVTASSTVTMALISVTDTGAGIAEDDLERVFQEFQQVGDLTARHSGTGLGLALTRRLVQAHGGKIEVRSEVGSGTTFTIHLPLVHEEHAVPDRPRAVTAGTAGRPGGILVIEDEPGAARLLRTYLEDAGYSVELAATGEAGLEAAHNFAPQAIVLDVLLPGIDGWEVLRRLKRDPAVRDIPVVIVTVVDEQEVGLDLGAVDYFVKPIDRELLLDRLSTLALIPPSVAPSSKVLVIDDDPGTRQIVTTNLTQRGYEVVTAATGVEGLRVARSQQFDLIICDLVMPDMDGYSVIAALNADFGSPHCPIVVFTAHDVADTDRGRLEGRVLGVVQKGEAAQAGLREWVEWITNQPDAPGFSTVPQPVQAVSARTQGAS